MGHGPNRLPDLVGSMLGADHKCQLSRVRSFLTKEHGLHAHSLQGNMEVHRIDFQVLRKQLYRKMAVYQPQADLLH